MRELNRESPITLYTFCIFSYLFVAIPIRAISEIRRIPRVLGAFVVLIHSEIER